MPTYTDASRVLNPHRGTCLNSWLCPRDGSLVLVFGTAGVHLRVSDEGRLLVTPLSREAIEGYRRETVLEGQSVEQALAHLVQWQQSLQK